MWWHLPVGIAAIFVLRVAISVAWQLLRPRDETEGHFGLKEAATLFKRRDWDALVALYLDLPPADRVHFLRGLGAITKPCRTLTTTPSAEMATIEAGLRVAWAWKFRGAGLGANVSTGQATRMVEQLSLAQALIENLGDKADSVACALGIRIEMGLTGNRGALQRFLNRAETLREDNYFVPYNHLMFIAPKWHGSVDEILETASEYAAASNNPTWRSLPAMAHAEAILFSTQMDTETKGANPTRQYYTESGKFRDELTGIDDAFWRAREQWKQPMGYADTLYAHNCLAYLHYRMKDLNRLNRHLDCIDALTFNPWAYSGLQNMHPKDIRKRCERGVWD